MKPYAYALTSSPEKTAEYFAWSPHSASFLKRSLRKNRDISFRLSKKIGWKKGRKQTRLIFEQMCFTSLRSPPAWVYECGLRKLLLSAAMWGDAATCDLEHTACWDQHLWLCVEQEILGDKDTNQETSKNSGFVSGSRCTTFWDYITCTTSDLHRSLCGPLFGGWNTFAYITLNFMLYLEFCGAPPFFPEDGNWKASSKVFQVCPPGRIVIP